jgi:hypothetical protein
MHERRGDFAAVKAHVLQYAIVQSVEQALVEPAPHLRKDEIGNGAPNSLSAGASASVAGMFSSNHVKLQ